MDEIILKKKPYKIIEKLGERTFKVERKKKTFVIKALDEKTYENFKNSAKTLKIAGISTPKVLKYDNNSMMVLLQYLPFETTCLDDLVKAPLSDIYFQEIFRFAWYARYEKIKLDYHPDNFVLLKDKMYYLPFTFERGYTEEDAFQLVGLKYWFYTKELVKYLNSKGIEVDKSRLKDEYQINKEMVLCVCKFHH